MSSEPIKGGGGSGLEHGDKTGDYSIICLQKPCLHGRAVGSPQQNDKLVKENDTGICRCLDCDGECLSCKYCHQPPKPSHDKLEEIMDKLLYDITTWKSDVVPEALQAIKQLMLEERREELTAVINAQVLSDSEKEFCDWLNNRRYQLKAEKDGE